MYHDEVVRKICTEVWSDTFKRNVHMGDLGVDGKTLAGGVDWINLTQVGVQW
jgi:hypothetical protein